MVPSGDENLQTVRWVHSGKTCRGLIVQFHGNAANLTAHAPAVSWLAGEGYDVVAFDYRGYGLSSGTPTREGLVQDGAAVLKYFVDHIPECPRHIVIGQSLGGAVSGPSIVHSGVTVDALVLDSTFPSYRRIARQKLGSLWPTWLFQWPLSFLVSDSEALEDYFDRLTMPVVVLAGDRDKVVPKTWSEEIFEKLPAGRKQLWVQTGIGHTQSLTVPSVRKRLLRFLDGDKFSKQGRIEKEPFLTAARPAGLRPPQSPSSTGLQARLRGLLCASSPAGLSLVDNWLFLDASLFRLAFR
ncbi:MAG: alpha/beta fold hydrolase [Deltaproteobacteria bacterium]|nr:alpha/beta fold hydrolase [Deltaproteobacteria bacterium]MBI3294676.1 alpha/beta fold hydrolase [Deltaproteobacteria bacterium]